MDAFKNILVPVDTFENSYPAVEKALDLYDSADVSIHLVKIIRNKNYLLNILYWLTGRGMKKKQELKKAGREELKRIRAKIREAKSGLGIVSTILVKRNYPAAMKKYLAIRKIDLVVTTQRFHMTGGSIFQHPGFNRISRQTGIPVLTVLWDHAASLSKSILIPVAGSIPEQKVLVALEMARKYHAQIYIVAILDDSKSNVIQHIDAFYLVYKLFSEYGHVPQYKILIGQQKDEMLFRYAQQLRLSMLYVNGNKENGSSGYIKRKVSGILHPFNRVTGLPAWGN